MHSSAIIPQVKMRIVYYHRVVCRRLFGHFFALCAVALLLLFAAACRKGGGPAGEGSVIKIENPPPPQGFAVVAEDLQTTGTRLTLSWRGAPPKLNEDLDPIGLCLPADEQISARWVRGSRGGRPIVIQTAATPTTLSQNSASLPEKAASVDTTGMLRHWPIYSLKPGREVNELFQRGVAATSASLELTLDLHWRKPVKIGPSNDAKGLSKAEASWLRVASGLAANPADLPRFQVDHPALAKDAAAKITDPRRLTPGNRPWARVQITTAGLTRLDPDDLLKAGFPPSEIKPDAVRVFSHGRAVPLLLAPSPGAPPRPQAGGLFLRPGRSGALFGGAGPIGSRWAAICPPAGWAPCLPCRLRPRRARWRRSPRTALRNEDTTFVTLHDNFEAIEAMAQVEQQLEPGKPILVGLDLPGYAPTSSSLEAEIDIFINREETTNPFKVEAVSDGEALGVFNFFTVADGKKKFKLPPHCVKNGHTTISLRLFAEGAVPPSDDGGFWLDRLQIGYPSAPVMLEGRLRLPGDGSTTHTLWTPLPDQAAAAPPAGARDVARLDGHG